MQRGKEKKKHVITRQPQLRQEAAPMSSAKQDVAHSAGETQEEGGRERGREGAPERERDSESNRKNV